MLEGILFGVGLGQRQDGRIARGERLHLGVAEFLAADGLNLSAFVTRPPPAWTYVPPRDICRRRRVVRRDPEMNRLALTFEGITDTRYPTSGSHLAWAIRGHQAWAVRVHDLDPSTVHTSPILSDP
jgi:hypothetical protein